MLLFDAFWNLSISLHLHHANLTSGHHHLTPELLKQSDTVSLLLSLGFEFDIFHLSHVSPCFISAMCYGAWTIPFSILWPWG